MRENNLILKKVLSFAVILAMIVTFVPSTAFAYGTKPVDKYGFDLEWYNYRNNQENNGVTEVSTPISDETASEKWAVKYGSGWSAAPTPPVIVDGKLYVGVSNKILELDKETGEKLRETDEMYGSVGYAMNPITYADGKLFVQVGNGVIQAIDLKTFKCIWHTEKLSGLNDTVSPIAYTELDGKGYIYTGTWGGEKGDGTFFCVSTDNEGLVDDTNEATANKGGGKIKSHTWDFIPSQDDKQLQGTANSKRGFYWAGAYSNENYVAVGSDDGTDEGDYTANAVFYTLNPKTGKIIDSIANIKGDIRTTVVYDNGHLYFGTKGGLLYKVDVDKKGNLSNESYVDLGGMMTASPLVYKNKIYVGVAGKGGQFDPDGGHSFKVIDNSGKLNQDSVIYELPIAGYPQASALLSNAYENEDFDGDGKADGRVYIYFTYNAKPGGIYYTYDTPDGKEIPEISRELFVPEEDKQQYCISTISTDKEGTLYYKNDSCYLMAVENNPAFVKNVELTSDNGSKINWNKAFDQKAKEYNVTTSSNVKSLKVKLSLPEGVTAKVNGKEYKENMSIDIDKYDRIKVTAKIGEFKKTYTIDIVKNSDSVALKTFEVNDSNTFGGGTVSEVLPHFNVNNTDYRSDVTNTVLEEDDFYRLWLEGTNADADIDVTAVDNVSEIGEVAGRGDFEGTRFNIDPQDVNKTVNVQIKVTSQDGKNSKVYNLSLLKAPKDEGITVDSSKLSMDIVDKPIKLNADLDEQKLSEANPNNVSVNDTENNGLKWTSDNESVVKVSDDGTVTPVASGIAVITVTNEDGSKTASIVVEVSDKAADVISMIDNFGLVTVDSKEEIENIKNIFDSLTPEQQARAKELGFDTAFDQLNSKYEEAVMESEEENQDTPDIPDTPGTVDPIEPALPTDPTKPSDINKPGNTDKADENNSYNQTAIDPDAVKTGDPMNITDAVTLMILSAASLLAIVFGRRKEKR